MVPRMSTHCFCSAGFEKWQACLKMRKVATRIAKTAAAPPMIVDRLCHVKLPTMSCIAADIGQCWEMSPCYSDVRGPLLSTVGHVCFVLLDWWFPIITKRYCGGE